MSLEGGAFDDYMYTLPLLLMDSLKINRFHFSI